MHVILQAERWLAKVTHSAYHTVRVNATFYRQLFSSIIEHTSSEGLILQSVSIRKKCIIFLGGQTQYIYFIFTCPQYSLWLCKAGAPARAGRQHSF